MKDRFKLDPENLLLLKVSVLFVMWLLLLEYVTLKGPGMSWLRSKESNGPNSIECMSARSLYYMYDM